MGLKEREERYMSEMLSVLKLNLVCSMRSVAFVSNVAFRGGGVVLDNVDCRWYDVDFNGNDSAELGDAVAAKQRVILRGAKIDYHKDTVEKWCRFVDGFALY